MGAPGKSNNPLEHDPDLQRLMLRLEAVRTARAFGRWRKQFLRCLDPYLPEVGRDKAAHANEAFNKQLQRSAKAVNAVHLLLDTPALSVESVSVRGHTSLSEMNRLLHETVEELEQLVPLKPSEEKIRGYNKYQLGAVLVRDGFIAYCQMTTTCQQTAEMRKGSLRKIADKQVLGRMLAFQQSFQRFCDIMNDLGLYKVMLEAEKYGDFEEDEDDLVVFFDLKTGQIGQLYRDECIGKGIFTENGEENGSSILEAAKGPAAQEGLLKMIRESLQTIPNTCI